MLLWGSTPAAADPDADARQRAARLTEEGAAAVTRKEWPAALDHFQAANRIFSSANLRYDMGVALAGLGRDLEALDVLEAFLAEAPDAPPKARAFAQSRIAEL